MHPVTAERVEAPLDAHHPTAVTPARFKAALADFASGVTIVTAVDTEEEDDVAMTATAFISVALEPPLVLVSVGEGSRMYDLLQRQDLWAVSVLAHGQRHLASRFAQRGRPSDRLLFADVPRHRGEQTGAFLLDGALTALECRTQERVVAGDHILVVAQVLSIAHPSPAEPPLLYFRSRYRRLRERGQYDTPARHER